MRQRNYCLISVELMYFVDSTAECKYFLDMYSTSVTLWTELIYVNLLSTNTITNSMKNGVDVQAMRLALIGHTGKWMKMKRL